MFLLLQYTATQINFEMCVFKDNSLDKYVVGIGNVIVLVVATCFSVSVTNLKQ